jgi:uncharacterized metal-binding protein (TIGR02443 family)
MTRRFIAGAVCPRCGAMDKLLVDSETATRECVKCGFSDGRPADNVAVREVPTRVTRPSARRVETLAEPITLVPAKPDKGPR